MHVQRIAGCSGSPEAPGLCHFNRKERKMRELTQSEIVAVAGGWECTVGFPHGVSCTFSDEEIHDWVCDTFGWWCRV